MNKIIDLGIIEQQDEIVADGKIVTVENDNQVILHENNNSNNVTEGMKEFGIVNDLTAEELFDVGVTSINSSIYHAVRAGVAFIASQKALLSGVSAMADTTFKSWILNRGLSRQRVYESIAIAKTYLAIPPEQRKKYIAVGQYKARKLAALEPEVIKEIAEQDPDKLDEFALMSRAELKAEIDKLKKRVVSQETEIEIKDDSIFRLKNQRRLTSYTPETEAVRAECLAMQAECELPLNSLFTMFDQCYSEGEQAPEYAERMEQIWITANVINARAVDLLTKIQESVREEFLPERIHGQHMMSPEEAERWIIDYRNIANRHHNAKTERVIKREEAAPRGRGRPKKVTR